MALGDLLVQKQTQDATRLKNDIAKLENDLYYGGVDLNVATGLPGVGSRPKVGTQEYLNWLNNVATKSGVGVVGTETLPTVQPAASTDVPYREGISDPSLQFVKAPTQSELNSAIDELKMLHPNWSQSQALTAAKELLNKQAVEQSSAQFETQVREQELKDYLARYPEQQKGIREALSKELGSYQSDLFNKELLPQVYQTMAARGLSGGSLDQAIAGSAEKLSREREATLAGMASQSSLAQSQLEYENALRQAQGAGLKEAGLTDYARNQQESGKQMAYGAGQSSLQRAFQAQQAELANQRAIEAETRQNTYNERALANQSQGNLFGTGLRGLIGAGIGLAFPGVGVAQGALSGLSGQYLPKDWFKS